MKRLKDKGENANDFMTWNKFPAFKQREGP